MAFLTKVLANFYDKKSLDKMPEINFKHITLDSRNIKSDSVFISLAGIERAGREYIDSAISNGAIAILVESNEDIPDFTVKSISEIPLIYLPDLRKNSGKILNEVEESPSKYMEVVTVTGTNGKTTIAYFLTQALNFLDKKTGYIGTLGYGKTNKMQPLKNTTPGVEQLNKIFQEFYADKFENIALEVSSHAIKQFRLSGLNLNAAIFTNITHEHLDYHKNLEEYAKTKFKLFTESDITTAIINIDDGYGKKLYDTLKENKRISKLYSYSLMNENADVYLEKANYVKEGTDLVIVSPWGKMTFSVKIYADYNISNLMAVYTYLCSINIHQEQAIKAITKLKSPPGRFNYLRFNKCSDIIIDYAHTPNALESLLKGVKKHMKNAKINLVFGCGGNRDKEKRPKMGKIATKYADKIILTSDNPRDEDPEKIIKEIATGIISFKARSLNKEKKNDDLDAGITKEEKDKLEEKNTRNILKELSKTNTSYEVDRFKAIEKAIKMSDRNDLVIVSGKGQETTQEIKGEIKEFNDEKVVKSIVKGL